MLTKPTNIIANANVDEMTRRTPIILDLETYDGSGEATHPDVLKIEGGFGSENWVYWMAITPYPASNDVYENPSIFVSNDGIKWEIPTGLTNPIAVPDESTPHYADTDIIHYNGTLYVYWRQGFKTIMSMSTDGITWTEKQAVISRTSGGFSPAVIHDESNFRMFTVENKPDWHIEVRESLDGITWGEPTTCTLLGELGDKNPWHLDVVINGNRLDAIITTARGLGNEGEIHYAYSLDDGMTWNMNVPFINPYYQFESDRFYRTCLMPIDGVKNLYHIWYSCRSNNNIWSTAYMRAVRIDNQLYPAGL